MSLSYDAISVNTHNNIYHVVNSRHFDMVVYLCLGFSVVSCMSIIIGQNEDEIFIDNLTYVYDILYICKPIYLHLLHTGEVINEQCYAFT